jgi:hypothetical protein
MLQVHTLAHWGALLSPDIFPPKSAPQRSSASVCPFRLDILKLHDKVQQSETNAIVVCFGIMAPSGATNREYILRATETVGGPARQ